MKVGDWVEYKHKGLRRNFKTYGWVTMVAANGIYMRKVATVDDRTNQCVLAYGAEEEESRLFYEEVTLMDDELHPDDRAEIINLSLDSKDPGWFKELMEG